ncbi:MAG: phosphate ABC transporter permease PstA [Pirellulales bacterium]|nr:phosphate ABC transporter permease PstA [Pirellulales bacterium]
MRPRKATQRFWRQGEPFVWASGAALALTLSMTAVLLGVVLRNGLGVFWPSPVAEVELADGTRLLGEELQTQINPDTGVESVKFKVGNMEDGPAFRWVEKRVIRKKFYPPGAFVLERLTNMNYYGTFQDLQTPGWESTTEGTPAERLDAALAAVRDQYNQVVQPLADQQAAVAEELKSRLKYQILRAEYDRKHRLAEGAAPDADAVVRLEKHLAELRADEQRLKQKSDRLTAELSEKEANLRRNVAIFRDAQGREKPIALLDIVRYTRPNQMGFGSKAAHYGAKIWELLTADPRESNQDGGLYPAIFGTVLMVFLMAATCFPLGVVAGVYLGEYAKEGPLVRLVRIAVNNLAGIPSIVYGVFGLGFFIYLIGGQFDAWFFPERVEAGEPVFGQGCILWASLTLGLLTIPVVIVSTEEALRAIPRGVREGSYALGATKLQTLWRVLVPMASPGMMTGFILAMARAAGEVAPLMLTGAVKNAPVPLDSTFPFLHPDRQFMHLGYHILDISCKSPNVEATKPMVYVTTLLLLLIVLSLSSVAIYLRSRMRKRYYMRAI